MNVTMANTAKARALLRSFIVEWLILIKRGLNFEEPQTRDADTETRPIPGHGLLLDHMQARRKDAFHQKSKFDGYRMRDAAGGGNGAGASRRSVHRQRRRHNQ